MNKLNDFIIEQYCKFSNYGYRYANLCLFVFGVCILTYGLAKFSYADVASSAAEDIIKEQLCKILTLIQGPFGALITIVAGLAAIVTAAMGGYKLAMSCVVIACGSYIISAFVALFFGPDMVTGDGCPDLPGVKQP